MIAGFVVWEGPSAINGMPVVCIVTLKSKNAKIGKIAQVWYLRSDMHPIEAIQCGADDAVCGNCSLRGINGKQRACYVNPLHGATPVWNAWKRGNYPQYDPAQHAHLLAEKTLRLGAYGEPICVPLTVQKPIIRAAKHVIGYTHYWNRKRYQHWAKHLMASVHSISQRQQALKLGWRTYRARLPEQSLVKGEFICPGSTEAGHRLTCEQCGACDGASPTKASPVIVVHGSPSKVIPVITRYTKAA